MPKTHVMVLEHGPQILYHALCQSDPSFVPEFYNCMANRI